VIAALIQFTEFSVQCLAAKLSGSTFSDVVGVDVLLCRLYVVVLAGCLVFLCIVDHFRGLTMTWACIHL